MAGIAIALFLVLAIRPNVSTTDTASSNTTITRKIADIKQFSVYKLGTETPKGEKLMQAFGKTALTSLPAKADRHTLVVFDGGGDYITANKDNPDFRTKIKNIIDNNGKLISIGPNHKAFVSMLRGGRAHDRSAQSPILEEWKNGVKISTPALEYTIGYKVNPSDALCTSLDGKTVTPCGMIESILGPTVMQDDAALSIKILEWIGDE